MTVPPRTAAQADQAVTDAAVRRSMIAARLGAHSAHALALANAPLRPARRVHEVVRYRAPRMRWLWVLTAMRWCGSLLAVVGAALESVTVWTWAWVQPPTDVDWARGRVVYELSGAAMPWHQAAAFTQWRYAHAAARARRHAR